MVLPDHEIERIAQRGAIHPYEPSSLQPSSYDVQLGNTFRVMYPYGKGPSSSCIDPFDQELLDLMYERIDISDGEVFMLYPNRFALGVTKERVRVPDDLVCRLEGRSSMGRLGVTVHITAGYIDPGFVGNITLEMANFAPRPVILTPGMRIAQIGFHQMLLPARKPYSGRYQYDSEATHSRYGKDEKRA